MILPYAAELNPAIFCYLYDKFFYANTVFFSIK